MKKLAVILMLISTAVLLQGCVHKIVTVPVKAAYVVTKGAVKGSVAVAKAVIPGDSDDKKNQQ